MQLQTDTICGVRKLGNFVQARIGQIRKTVDAVCREGDLSRPSVYRVLNAANAEEAERTHSNTRESLASALGFREWEELLEAWRANDVRLGLAPPSLADLQSTMREQQGRKTPSEPGKPGEGPQRPAQASSGAKTHDVPMRRAAKASESQGVTEAELQGIREILAKMTPEQRRRVIGKEPE